MLSIFNKKHFLGDCLEGLIDIHNHILPGIDDGAKTVEDSIALIEGLMEFGITDFICTPHIMYEYYENTDGTIKNAFELVKAKLKEDNLNDITLDYGAEHMIDANFENLLLTNEIVPMKRFNILIEMGFLQTPFNFSSAIEKILSKNLLPILAHPERYRYLKTNSNQFDSFKEKGIMLQVNILSLANYYGSKIKDKSYTLIENGYIDFIGSDIHHLKQIAFIKEATIPKKLVEKVKKIVEKTTNQFYS